jgi:hypothetical protein
MPNRDVGTPGLSGYDSEMYTPIRNRNGRLVTVVENKKNMALQGVDPKRQLTDSYVEEGKIQDVLSGRNPSQKTLSERQQARAVSLGNKSDAPNDSYNEGKFRMGVRDMRSEKTNKVREQIRAADRKVDMQTQKFAQSSPMAKAMVADFKKKAGRK